MGAQKNELYNTEQHEHRIICERNKAMGLIKYDLAKNIYKDDAFMSEIIERFADMDEYHLLRDTGNVNLVKEKLPGLSLEYQKWLSVCDGGLLFSTTLLGTKEYDEELDLYFSTIQEFQARDKRLFFQLPHGYIIIALLNYGDPVCLSEYDSRVYLWDTQEEEFSTVWDSFADFLADEYNIAVKMLNEDALEPVPLKVMEEQDG